MNTKQITIISLKVLAFFVLLYLKLTATYGVGDWSWGWITLPLWAWPVTFIVLLIGYMLFTGILRLMGKEIRNVR